VTTHPIQYNAPLFALLNARQKIDIKVFYTWGELESGEKFDPEFGLNIKWDIPLLEGYEYEFLKNISLKPGSHHFKGIDNPELVQNIRDWGANAILVFGWAFKSHLNCIRKFSSSIPVFFRGDSVSLHKTKNFKYVARHLFLRWVYTHIDHALCVGTHNRNYFLEHGLKDKQIIFAPHAIDNARFSSSIKNKEASIKAWKQTLGIFQNDIVLLFAGKLNANKNPELLIKAFLLLQKPGIQLIITGDGILKHDLMRKYGEFPQIHFLPFQNQSVMPLVYGLADIFVLPSLSETWGLGINEAMASSKAIIVSETCGAAIDLVNEGANGYIFKNNDVSDLKNKILTLISSLANIKNMGLQSAEIIKSWSFLESAKTIEKLMLGTKQV
jgi:glycosyltransferase involved in cell wall biosynthesis